MDKDGHILYNLFNPLENYKQYYINIHREISKYYMNLNQKNFELNYTELNNYLLDKKDELNIDINITELLTKLKLFKNIPNNAKSIIEDSRIVVYLNNLLNNDNFELKKKLSYFIACYMKVLDLSEEWSSKDSIIKFKRIIMDFELIQFQERVKNIIFFKTFFSSKPLSNFDQNESFGIKIFAKLSNLFALLSNLFMKWNLLYILIIMTIVSLTALNLLKIGYFNSLLFLK